MKKLLLACGLITAAAGFAAAQEQPVSPDVSSSSTQTTKQTTVTTNSNAAVPDTTVQTTESSATTVTGTVQTYDAGKDVTIVRPDGSTVTYSINGASQLPSGMAIGREVTVTTTSVAGSPQPVIRKVTYKTKTTTTKKDVEPPH